MGGGLGALLEGNGNGERNRNPARNPATRRSQSLKWLLLAADVLLVVLAYWIVFGRADEAGFWDILLGLLAVGLAAGLGCWAFLLHAAE